MTRDEAIAKLRELLHPGDTVQTILRHVSRSGMSRSISPVIAGEDVSYLVAPAVGYSLDRKHGGVRMGGTDPGPDLVVQLSRVLGFYQPKTGARCGCRPGIQRDNCPACEGTGQLVDFAAIRQGAVGLRHRWL